MYYQEMIDAVTECEVGYKAPSSEKLKSTLLEKVKADINLFNDELRFVWKETGCTILCNCCSNGDDVSLLVFSATCPRGSLFIKHADISGHEDDARYLFELIESVVLEVGLEHVVQVITDSSSDSYVMVGEELTMKYSTLFWSPCVFNCINEMLEDFSKLDWISTVLKEAEIIASYIHNHQSKTIGNFFADRARYIGRKNTKFVDNFLFSRSIVTEKDNLMYMLTRPEWVSSTCWNSAQEVVYITEPIIKVLRIVDGDTSVMGYIYTGMERAKVEIKEYYKGGEGKYVPIWEIIDRKWNLMLRSPLLLVATFLNPSIFYGGRIKIDSRIRNGFQEGLKKILVDEAEKIEVTKEIPMYINARGALFTEFAIMGRKLNAPGDWWMTYGYEIPVLQRSAIWILSQPCSSHWCRWNCSTFKSLHTEKYNISELEKIKDLVFVHCNLWLNSISRSRGGRFKPIDFDHIDIGCQWPTDFLCSSGLLDDLWLDNLLHE